MNTGCGVLRTQPIDCGSGVRLERGAACRMSDGTQLYSDHYYPAVRQGSTPGKNPTLLMRQPYGRDIASTVVNAHPVWFASHGYNVVIQDVRGRGDSEGEFYPFRNERRDGAETIAWLRTRPESDGRIGMYGFSYQGMTQLLAAAARPEGLVCIAPAMTAHDLYHGWFYQGGALRLASSLGWGLQMLKADARRLKLRDASDALEAAWISLGLQAWPAPYGRHTALQFAGLPAYVRDWFEHDEPGQYWSELDVSTSVADIDVPALHLSGWYDTYLQGSIDGFLTLCKHAGSKFARDNQYLVAGPWVHIPWGDRAGEAHFGDEALLDTDALLLRWFNHWLRDSGEFASEPRVRHFALGANRWFECAEWPASPQVQSYFLHSGGRANSRKGDGCLSAGPPDQDQPRDVFVYDPEVPVLAPGGPAATSGGSNQAQLELGNNVLVYTTEPLSQPLHVCGSASVSLYCATSADHSDFTSKLVRLTPDGVAHFIAIGMARSSLLFREPGYRADQVHCWRFALEPTSCVFAAGDCIRLEIASSAFPLFDRNPSAAVKPCEADSWSWLRSTQFVLHDADHPSALHLPVLEGPAS
ncbi:MAG TPA: CocE/NonD family hydrolase [Acidisarcina sp.]